MQLEDARPTGDPLQDVEFVDETESPPQTRLDRVPFDDSKPVRELNRELGTRSKWSNFDTFVRKGYDGVALHLNEKDLVMEAVAPEESR